MMAAVDFTLGSFAWVGISVLIATISLFITIFLHMVAQAFSLQNLTMWVKSEYAQVAVSFLIIFFAVGMQSAGGAVVNQVAAEIAAASGNLMLISNMPTPYDMGEAYIMKVVDCERKIYSIAYWLNVLTEPMSKISTEFLGAEGISGGALVGFVSFYHYIMNNLTYIILFNYVQYSMLLISKYAMLYPILPIGLVLRAFAPTRGAGGLVIAFALGFAFIFPFSYVLIVAAMPNTAYTMCNQVAVINNSLPLDGEQPCYNSRAGIREQEFKLKSHTQEIHGIVDYLQTVMGVLLLEAIVYPLVCLIITFSFIRQTGSLFGADLAEIGRGLIKII